MRIYIFLVILLILFSGYLLAKVLSPSQNTNFLPTASVKIKDVLFNLEIAQTTSQKMLGLGNRKSLCDTCGMIFVYSVESFYPFWMKDTLIPLDMIWLDQTGKVVTILTALPEPGVPLWQLKNYTNTQKAKYIIELNSGTAKKLNLQLGDSLDVSKF